MVEISKEDVGPQPVCSPITEDPEWEQKYVILDRNVILEKLIIGQ